MVYYIDGLDYPFESFGEIRKFVLSLREPKMLYLMIDRHVYVSSSIQHCVFMHCGVLEVGHFRRSEVFGYVVDIIRTSDNNVYSSEVFGFNRFFSRLSSHA